MRNIIRTSHEQRRRSSAAITADQLQHLTSLSEQGARRSSLAQGLLLESGEALIRPHGHLERRRVHSSPDAGCTSGLITAPDSLLFRKSPLIGQDGGGVSGGGGSGTGSGSGSPVSGSPLTRRRAKFERKHSKLKTQKSQNNVNMEIKTFNVAALVLIIAAAFLLVALLAYFLRRSGKPVSH